ncbi:MAG: HupE/UreJ family protein, partial [Burkholderiales bacterium]
MTSRGQVSLTERMPWLVAFVFGLLHGLGFAGALAEIGLPQNAIPLALLRFNIGVEIGQAGLRLSEVAVHEPKPLSACCAVLTSTSEANAETEIDTARFHVVNHP